MKTEKLSLSLIKGCIPVDGDTYDVPLQIQTVDAAAAITGKLSDVRQMG